MVFQKWQIVDFLGSFWRLSKLTIGFSVWSTTFLGMGKSGNSLWKRNFWGVKLEKDKLKPMMTIWVKSYSTLKFNSLNSRFAPENRVSKLAPKRKGLDFFSSSFFFRILAFPGFPLAVKSEVRWYFLIKAIQRLAEGVLQSWCGETLGLGEFRWRLRSFVSKGIRDVDCWWTFLGGWKFLLGKMVSSFSGGFGAYWKICTKFSTDELGVYAPTRLVEQTGFFWDCWWKGFWRF